MLSAIEEVFRFPHLPIGLLDHSVVNDQDTASSISSVLVEAMALDGRGPCMMAVKEAIQRLRASAQSVRGDVLGVLLPSIVFNMRPATNVTRCLNCGLLIH